MTDTTDIIGDGGEDIEAIATGWRASLFGLGAALCWAISPIFIRRGLKDLPSPLLGVTVGMIACVVAYGLVLLLRRGQFLRRGSGQGSGQARGTPIPHDALFSQLMAGVLVGLATWARYIALDLAPVAVVVALGRVSAPTVILVAPLVVGRHLERVTARVWLGAALIVAGSLLLVLYR
ncbi:MAG: EamA family transporter [Anaerolineae bacterium]